MAGFFYFDEAAYDGKTFWELVNGIGPSSWFRAGDEGEYPWWQEGENMAVEYRVTVHFPDGDSTFTLHQVALEDVKNLVRDFTFRVMGTHDGAPYEVWKGEELLIGSVPVTEGDRLILSAMEGNEQ